jgi:hypothetical protein
MGKRASPSEAFASISTLENFTPHCLVPSEMHIKESVACVISHWTHSLTDFCYSWPSQIHVRSSGSLLMMPYGTTGLNRACYRLALPRRRRALGASLGVIGTRRQ